MFSASYLAFSERKCCHPAVVAQEHQVFRDSGNISKSVWDSGKGSEGLPGLTLCLLDLLLRLCLGQLLFSLPLLLLTLKNMAMGLMNRDRIILACQEDPRLPQNTDGSPSPDCSWVQGARELAWERSKSNSALIPHKVPLVGQPNFLILMAFKLVCLLHPLLPRRVLFKSVCPSYSQCVCA